jgi:hypothetical protein
MKRFFPIFYFVLAVFAISCEKSDDQPNANSVNPFIDQADSNGFSFQNTWYNTPFGILEIWGENNEESADFDLKFSDSNILTENIDSFIMVYLDLNSPDLTKLSEGIYYFQSSLERTPNSMVDAYIIFKNNKTTKLQILNGEAEVKNEGLFFLIKYNLETIILDDNTPTKINIIGQYSGRFDVIDNSLQN